MTDQLVSGATLQQFLHKRTHADTHTYTQTDITYPKCREFDNDGHKP